MTTETKFAAPAGQVCKIFVQICRQKFLIAKFQKSINPLQICALFKRAYNLKLNKFLQTCPIVAANFVAVGKNFFLSQKVALRALQSDFFGRKKTKNFNIPKKSLLNCYFFFNLKQMGTIHEAYLQCKDELAKVSKSSGIYSCINTDFNEIIG